MLDNSIECTDSHRSRCYQRSLCFDYKESEVCVFKLNYMNYSNSQKYLNCCIGTWVLSQTMQTQIRLLLWSSLIWVCIVCHLAGCYMDCIYQGGYGPLPYKIHRNISERSFTFCSFKCRCPSLSCPLDRLPPGASQPWLACPPGGNLSRDILPPTLVTFTPGGQHIPAGLSCPRG